MRMKKLAAGRSVNTIACEILWLVDEELSLLHVKEVGGSYLDISDTLRNKRRERHIFRSGKASCAEYGFHLSLG